VIRSALHAALAVALAGCASKAMPPAGPKHVPAASAEAETECPKERAQAQAAREALLGETAEELRLQAAESVFAHGQCESQVFSALPAPTGTQDQILSALRAFRKQMQNAINLFREVPRYDAPLLAVQASVAEADVKLRFSQVVASITPPAELDDKTRVAFETELTEAVKVLRLEASTILNAALDAAQTTDGTSEAEAESCRLLATIPVSNAHCP
jgi:hypothetical protein